MNRFALTILPSFRKLAAGFWLLSATFLYAAEVVPTPAPALEPISLTGSFIRMIGALALVVALFFGGVWVMRNWQRFVPGNQRRQKLSIIEVKSLGNRHALYVIGYEQQRMLLSSSPTGVAMLTHLPDGDEVPVNAPAASPSFAEALTQVVGGKR